MNELPELDALFDTAVSRALAAARQQTGHDLPSAVQFLWQVRFKTPRRVARDEVIPLILANAQPSDGFILSTSLVICGVHDGRTIVLVRVMLKLVPVTEAFVDDGVRRPKHLQLPDGRHDWRAPLSWEDLEAVGREAVEECDRSSTHHVTPTKER